MNGLNSQSSVDDYHICLFINVGHDWIVLGFILSVRGNHSESFNFEVFTNIYSKLWLIIYFLPLSLKS